MKIRLLLPWLLLAACRAAPEPEEPEVAQPASAPAPVPPEQAPLSCDQRKLVRQRIHAGSNPSHVATCDFDGDGALDVAVTRLGWGPSASHYFTPKGELKVFFNDGTGTLAEGFSMRLVEPQGALTCGDVDGDGLAEVLAGELTAVVVLGLPGRVPQVRRLAVETSPSDLTLADLDGDARPELFGGGGHAIFHGVYGYFFVHRFDGRPSSSWRTGGSPRVAVGGSPSFAAFSLGGPSLSVFDDAPEGDEEWRSVGWPFPTDGAVEELIGFDQGVISVIPQPASIAAFGRADRGQLPRLWTVELSHRPASVVLQRLDSGRSRLVASAPDIRGLLSLGFDEAQGRVTSTRFLSTGKAPGRLASADLDGDGLSEVLAVEPGANTVAVLDPEACEATSETASSRGGPPRLSLVAESLPHTEFFEEVDLDQDGRGELALSAPDAGLILWDQGQSRLLVETGPARDIRQLGSADRGAALVFSQAWISPDEQFHASIDLLQLDGGRVTASPYLGDSEFHEDEYRPPSFAVLDLERDGRDDLMLQRYSYRHGAHGLSVRGPVAARDPAYRAGSGLSGCHSSDEGEYVNGFVVGRFGGPHGDGIAYLGKHAAALLSGRLFERLVCGGEWLGGGLAGDFDGDGYDDLVGNGAALRWQRNDQHGGFELSQPLLDRKAELVAVLDVTGDGKADVVERRGTRLTVLASDGASVAEVATFELGTTSPKTSLSRVTAAPTLLIQTEDGSVHRLSGP